MFLRKQINFTDPFVIRKWLKMLVLDEASGYRIRPNISYPAGVLGFSISSNQYGLRGPANPKADNVILGTSYAMGFGVDQGLDWYDRALNKEDWFNAGLPAGPQQWMGILDNCYAGNYRHALFIYHSNFIPHGIMFDRWQRSGKNLFEQLGWKTSLTKSLKLRLRQIRSRRAAERAGRIIYLKEGNQRWKINAGYSFLESRDIPNIQPVLEKLSQLLSRFARVTVIHVPIKESLVPGASQTRPLAATLEQHELLWHYTRRHLQSHPCISFQNAPSGRLEHYNHFDTHWSPSGNQFFADYVKDCIRREE